MTAMLYLIIIGAHVFGPFLALTHIPETLALELKELGLGPYGTLFLILLGYIILGMFFDGLAMLVVTFLSYFQSYRPRIRPHMVWRHLRDSH